jgi:hypothetical protein
VDATERLADFLAGELDADEHAAVEAALARDPALRAELEHLRRADTALRALERPPPPDGFEQRLHAAVTEELTRLGIRPETLTGAATAGTGEERAGAADRIAADELAAARARREARANGPRWPRWLPAFGGIAASLLLVAVAISVVGPFTGGDDSDTATFDAAQMDLEAGAEDAGEEPMEEEAADGAVETLDEGMAEDDEAVEEGAPADDAAAVLAAGPEVVASDRDLPPQQVADLLVEPAADRLVAIDLDAQAGSALAGQWARSLGADPEAAAGVTGDAGDRDPTDADDTAESSLPEADDPLAGLTPDDRVAVGRCLSQVLERDVQEAAIPAYVELLTVADEPAIAYVLVTAPADRFTATEAWVVARDDCRELASANG